MSDQGRKNGRHGRNHKHQGPDFAKMDVTMSDQGRDQNMTMCANDVSMCAEDATIRDKDATICAKRTTGRDLPRP